MKVFPMQFNPKTPWIVTTIVYGLKVIGLAPFSQQTETLAVNSRNTFLAKTFHVSRIGQAYNFLLLILIHILVAREFSNVSSVEYTNSSSMTHIIDGVMTFVTYFTADFIIIYLSLRQKIAVDMMNRLLKIDRLLSGIEKHPALSIKKMFLFITMHVIYNACLWITLTYTQVIQFSDFLVTCFLQLFLCLVIYSFIVGYCIVIGNIVRGLVQVNRNLLNLYQFVSDFSCVTMPNYRLPVLSSSTGSLFANLQLLRDIRTMLSDVAQDIADFFSFPILLSIGCFFLLLVYCIYMVIVLVLATDASFTVDDICNGIAWALIPIYPLTLLSFNVTKAGTEAKLTGRIVHKLLAAPIGREIQVKLQQFSLQLLHEQLSFTAYGFFTLDCTMLNSILGATATYLVILMQFQSSSNDSSNTSPEFLCETNRTV